VPLSTCLIIVCWYAILPLSLLSVVVVHLFCAFCWTCFNNCTDLYKQEWFFVICRRQSQVKQISVASVQQTIGDVQEHWFCTWYVVRIARLPFSPILQPLKSIPLPEVRLGLMLFMRFTRVPSAPSFWSNYLQDISFDIFCFVVFYFNETIVCSSSVGSVHSNGWNYVRMNIFMLFVLCCPVKQHQ